MRILAALILSVLSLPALAHEFWIEPEDYSIPADGNLQVTLVNGEDFEGIEIAYLPRSFRNFVIQLGGNRADVENRIGARPAMDNAPLGDGLHQIAYISRLNALTYTEWEKFVRFSDHKDFGDIAALHDARGLPREGFREGYWRFAKSLVGVGSAAGDDSRMGMEIEYVALDNPYTDDLTDGMRVQLFYGRDVRADAQVEVFEKAPDDTVVVTLYRTDANGIATIPVKPGHRYLVDNVVLREPSAEMAEAVDVQWETLWASLTFAVPE